MKRFDLSTAIVPLALCGAFGCGQHEGPHSPDDAGGTHPREDGVEHSHAPGEEHAEEHAEGVHEHDEVSLGTTRVGDLEVELAQGHGPVRAGAEGHLVVKLPYSDGGETVVRAWIGGEDRTLSYVGRGQYAPSHDDYDVHATAPDPLPEGVRWWVEVERPDGTRVVGSVEPMLE
jgi:hypothetical protein